MKVKEKIQLCIMACAVVALTPEIISLFYERVDWQQYSDRGRQLIKFGEPKEAVKYFIDQNRQVFKEEGTTSPRYIATLEGLSLAFQADEMYISAEEKLNEAKTLLESNFFKDREKLAHILTMKQELLLKQGLDKRAGDVREEIESLNVWWHWFWTGFFITFVTEALYMANVIGRPGDMELSHLKVEFASLYGFSLLIGTATMTKGLLMIGSFTFLQCLFIGPGIGLALLPLIFGLVMASSEHWVREDPLNHLKPSREASR